MLLAGYFLEVTARKLGIRQLKIPNDVQQALLAYSWPGNVRELEHVISRASLKATRSTNQHDIISLNTADLDFERALLPKEIHVQPTPQSSLCGNAEPQNLKTMTEAFQANMISRALADCQGNWTLAAKQLNMDRANLARLARRLCVQVHKNIKNETF